MTRSWRAGIARVLAPRRTVPGAEPERGAMSRRAIADLHCHYPMHLVPAESHPPGYKKSLLERLRDLLQSDIIGVLARVLNDRGWWSGWRVDVQGLEQGGTGLICSVLYWPAAEFDFARRYGSAPLERYFSDLRSQLQHVEADLNEHIARGSAVTIAKQAADLDQRGGVVFVHCVEGGFQLGPDIDTIDEHVAWLAAEGVFYITVAHLFYRRVATNAPAIPMLSDREYNKLFHQPKQGLTKLGEALVRSMHKHKVLIDVSHMTERSIEQTFALVEALDAQSGAAAHDYPLIATHVGMRSAGPGEQEYNLSPDTAKRIQARGGLIGLIMAQHQLGETSSEAQSREVLHGHLDAIAALGAGHTTTALGTDIDGFIRPTLEGIERASDLAKLAAWIEEYSPGDAGAILYGNAHRVIKRTFEVRAAALGALGGTSPPAPPG